MRKRELAAALLEKKAREKAARALTVTVERKGTMRTPSRPGMRVVSYASAEWLAAIADGNEGCVKRMVELGQDIHIRDKEGWNALHIAVQHGRDVIVRLLLTQGSHINARDRYGNTALMWACKYHLTAIAKMLLRAGASMTRQNKLGQTALMLAAASKDIDVVHAIISTCFRKLLQVQDEEGMTALHHACLSGANECCQKLVHNGSLVNLRTVSGHTPLMLACRRGHTDIVDLLLSSGADATVCVRKVCQRWRGGQGCCG